MHLPSSSARKDLRPHRAVGLVGQLCPSVAGPCSSSTLAGGCKTQGITLRRDRNSSAHCRFGWGRFRTRGCLIAGSLVVRLQEEDAGASLGFLASIVGLRGPGKVGAGAEVQEQWV